MCVLRIIIRFRHLELTYVKVTENTQLLPKPIISDTDLKFNYDEL